MSDKKQVVFNALTIEEIDEEKREVAGRALPFNQPAQYNSDCKLSVASGSLIPEAYLAWRHGEVIGAITESEVREDGIYIRARIDETSQGNDAWAMVKSGTVKQMSAGYWAKEENVTLNEDTFTHSSVELFEVSLVPVGRFRDQAAISEFGEEVNAAFDADITKIKENTIMTEVTNAPMVDEALERVSDLERKFAVLSESGTESNEGTKSFFNSFGEYAKALAEGNDKAITEYNAYTGGTTADSVLRNGWTADAIRLLDEGRPVFNAFSSGSLPAEGNFVEHAVLNTNTLTVDLQVNEGDDLPYGKVSVGSQVAKIDTYGGYTSMTRQEIERASVNILDLAFRGMAIEYARRTNVAVRTAAVAGATGAVTREGDTSTDWILAVVDAKAELEGLGLSADFVWVSSDVYRDLVILTDAKGNAVLDRGTGLGGSIDGVSVLRDKNLAAGTVIVANRNAVKTYESAGAPLRLSDENIINLTKDFSVYGYLAVGVEQPNGLVVVSAPVA